MDRSEKNVCLLCGDALRGSGDEACKFSEDGRHDNRIIYPVQSIEVDTFCCELCGKEWSLKDKICNKTKDGRHRYKMVSKVYVARLISNSSILK